MAGVDYRSGDVAGAYARGRALDDEALLRWHDALQPLLPDRPGLDILDVGAGTGIFARAWARWGARTVIALEPAGAMRAQLVGDGALDEIQGVAACAEHLPVRNGSVDVVWVSTVLHHIADVASFTGELRRVVAPGGVVLVRGLFADLGTPASVQFLPGWRDVVATFPDTEVVAAHFARQGLALVHRSAVHDVGPWTVAASAERIRKLRTADTLLARFSDRQIADGLAAMDARDPAERLAPSTLGLLAFRPRARP